MDSGFGPIGLGSSNHTGCNTSAKYEWVMKDFGECVTTDLMMAGFILGLLSNVCWLVAQGPQMWKNWRSGSVEGLSFVFLAEWLAGDITNLVGCLLTQQVQTQLFTAIYFCVIDSMMVGQHMYYNPPWKKAAKSKGAINAMLLPILVVAAVPLLYGMAPASWSEGAPDGAAAVAVAVAGEGEGGLVGFDAALQPMHSAGRVLLGYHDNRDITMPSRSALSSTSHGGGGGGDDGSDEVFRSGNHTKPAHKYDPKWAWSTQNGMIGYVLGWISGVLYFTSRIPQIRLNFKRKTCDGLNPVMFIMAVLGNLFYGFGVLMESVEVVFIINHLPWLLGSIGTLVFDFTIIMQYLAYGTPKDQRNERKRLHSDRVGVKHVYEDEDLIEDTDKLPLINPSSPTRTI